MKRISLLFSLIILTLNLFAQVPQKMSYQAVIRNASNNLVTNTPVKMKISILQGSPTGAAVYSELHSTNTNANGLTSIEIGAGTSPNGTFSSINWANGTYYLKTETDPNNGTNYTITGTSQLLSVPYALESNNAKNADNAKSAGNGFGSVSSAGDTLYFNNGKYIIIPGISNYNYPPIMGNVVDISNNTYTTVIIGKQTWMAENLNTTKYNDGSDIPIVTDSTQWANNFNNDSRLPMMCWYNNDQVTYTANKFGALYNGYAINPATNGGKNICPSGWHVPNEDDWGILTTFLGGASIAGGKLKSLGSNFWTYPNLEATNTTNFSGFPCGMRENAGNFSYIGEFCNWWCINTYLINTNDVIYIYYRLGNTTGVISRGGIVGSFANSVRCVKN